MNYTALSVLILTPGICESVRMIRKQTLRQILAALTITSLISIPIVFAPDSVGWRFLLAALCSSYSLKILQLFFGSMAQDISKMSSLEFIIRMSWYPEDDHLRRWIQTKQSRQVVQEGRAYSLQMFVHNVIKYYCLAAAAALFVPPRISHVIKSGSWFEFFMLFEVSGYGLWALMGLFFEFIFGVPGIVLGIKMIPVFDSPMSATTLREFWSRWNVCFKRAFHQIVFAVIHSPSTVSKKLKSSDDDDKKYHMKSDQARYRISVSDQNQQSAAASGQQSTVKGSKMSKLLAAMATFIFSGLIHEYYVFCMYGVGQMGYNMAFFVLHGLATCLCELLPKTSLPLIVKRLLVHLSLLALMPFFMLPFLSADFVDNIAVPVPFQSRLARVFFKTGFIA
ncbi:hypothetical protein MP228_001018 [Amoeboaphelidium protococcarum]|nr:hypothetical protein MP228_001018 [Amoeboaphelidium protococcarum]